MGQHLAHDVSGLSIVQQKCLLTATTHTMVPMTTLNWSYLSLLESISMCMEIWMMMASMKVILSINAFNHCVICVVTFHRTIMAC